MAGQCQRLAHRAIRRIVTGRIFVLIARRRRKICGFAVCRLGPGVKGAGRIGKNLGPGECAIARGNSENERSPQKDKGQEIATPEFSSAWQPRLS